MFWKGRPSGYVGDLWSSLVQHQEKLFLFSANNLLDKFEVHGGRLLRAWPSSIIQNSSKGAGNFSWPRLLDLRLGWLKMECTDGLQLKSLLLLVECPCVATGTREI
ncbi:hypothetical protein VPH35_080887 [Triticum aestivum]